MKSLTLAAVLMASGSGSVTNPGAACKAPVFEKPRVIVVSDIGDDPDDSQSMVRLLAYANA